MGALKKKIYIIHGWAYSTEKWGDFVSLLHNRGYDPVMLKVPGLTDKIDRPWDVDDYVKWLSDKLKNERKAVVIGHSNGGRIALSFTLLHPDKLAKLILIDSAGIRDRSVKAKVKRGVFGCLAKIGKMIPGASVFRNVLYKAAREKDYKEASDVMKKTMANLIKVDLRDKLSSINIPTIIIWGENDRQTPLSDAKIMNEKIKTSKLFIIKGAAHSPQFTHTREVVDILVRNGM